MKVIGSSAGDSDLGVQAAEGFQQRQAMLIGHHEAAFEDAG